MKEKIDVKYKMPIKGEYNLSVYICPECDCKLLSDPPHGSVFQHIIGFADTNNGLMAVVECPECFIKWHFHIRDNYDFFLEFIEQGEQKHFTK